MLPFFGKIVLLIAAAFGLGVLAGRRGRKSAELAQPVSSRPGRGVRKSALPASTQQASAASATSDEAGASPAVAPDDTRALDTMPTTVAVADEKPEGASAADHSAVDQTAPGAGQDASRSAGIGVPDRAASSQGAEAIAKSHVNGGNDDDGGEAMAALARLSATPHGPTPVADDPLTEKFRAEPFRRNFRSLDYSKLSLDEKTIEAERKRRRQHSTWHAPDPLRDTSAAAPTSAASGPAREFSGRFASFGGATVSADIIMGGEAGVVPDMTPTLPGDDPGSPTRPAVTGGPAHRPAPARREPIRLGGPHPDLPTPDRTKRAAVPPDPLAEKHRAASFDRDWRSLDYGRLRTEAGPSANPKRHDWSAKAATVQTGNVGDDNDPAAAYPAAFSALGVAAALQGAFDAGLSAHGEGDGQASRPSGARGTPLGAPGAHEGAMGLEPRRLDAPRGDSPDNLTRIKGIGPAIERLLFEHGVYHFNQIAGWSAGEAQWIDQMIGFAGRVEREDWMAQAKGLADDADAKG